MQRGGVLAGGDGQRIEGGFVDDVVAEFAQARGQNRGHPVHTQRDRAQALRPVIDRIHAGHDREQHLRGTNIRGGFLATDVLLASLQRQAQRRFALRIDGHADQPARHLALEFVAHRHVAGVRAAKAHRYAETLGVAHGHIGAPYSGRF